jgi:uncharacterized membrane protein
MTNNSFKYYALSIGGGALLIVLVQLLIYRSNVRGQIADDTATFGQFGDYFGGVLNPLIGIINLVLLMYLAREVHQADENRTTNEKDSAQNARAIELLQHFLTNPEMVEARLENQRSLIEDRGVSQMSFVKHRSSTGFGSPETVAGLMNLAEIAEVCAQASAIRRDVGMAEAIFKTSVRIRALVSFFWLVDQAKERGYIKADDTFRQHYCWYWVHILRFRLKGCQDNIMFRRIDWLLQDNQGNPHPGLKNAYEEFKDRVAAGIYFAGRLGRQEQKTVEEVLLAHRYDDTEPLYGPIKDDATENQA